MATLSCLSKRYVVLIVSVAKSLSTQHIEYSSVFVNVIYTIIDTISPSYARSKVMIALIWFIEAERDFCYSSRLKRVILFRRIPPGPTNDKSLLIQAMDHCHTGKIYYLNRKWPMTQWPTYTFQLRHNERDGISNHQPHDCLLNLLFRRRSKKTSKLRGTGLCAGNSPVTDEFPAQRASNAEMFPFDDVIMYTTRDWSFYTLQDHHV